MKWLISILAIVFLFSCSTPSSVLVRLNELEKQVAEKEDVKEIGPVVSKDELKKLAAEGAAVKIRGFTGTTGGTTGSLDDMSCLTPADGDLAMVFNTTTKVITFHEYDSTLGETTELDPEYVLPDDQQTNCSANDPGWVLFSGFRYLASTTPTVNFRDFNNTDIETVVAKIEAEATATGSGVEDADMKLSAVSAGNITDKEMIILNGNSGLELYYRTDEAWLDDDSYSGIVIDDHAAGETITQWQVVYMDSTDDEWKLADADLTATPEFPARGIAVEACSNAVDCKVLVNGWVRNDAWNWTAHGEDGNLYLSDTPGGILTATQAATNLATSGDCVQLIGWAITDDTAYFNFSGHWNEVE